MYVILRISFVLIVIHTGLLWSVYIDSHKDCYGVSILIVIYTGLLWSVYIDSHKDCYGVSILIVIYTGLLWSVQSSLELSGNNNVASEAIIELILFCISCFI